MKEPLTDPPGQTPPGTEPPGQTPNPQSQTTSGSQQTPITSLPQDIQDYIARLRDEAEAANKAKKAEAKAKQAAEEARLAEQGQFKELASKHELRVKELEPIAQSYNALAETLSAQIDAEIKDWPSVVKALVPGADVPVEQRLAQMTRLRPLLEKLQLQTRGQQPGNRPNPAPVSQQDARQQHMEANRASFVQKRSYGF